MSDAGNCGGCAGIGTETPAGVTNDAGLPAVVYRIGTQPAFKASLLARLSSHDYPALAPLTARADDDWTIGLLDAFSCAADVITFYQERIINESFLRTATELRSVTALAQLIGYRPAPGVAASTAFAFTLDTSPGQPALAAQPVTIPAGTRVQSVPDPNQSPQNFETVEDITALVEWNALAAQVAQWPAVQAGGTDLFVAGTGLQIQPGDVIALVGGDRYLSTANAGLSDVRWLDRVEEDSTRGLTRLVWSDALADGWSTPPASALHVYVFRQRGALFGQAAPNPNLLYTATNQLLFSGTPPDVTWPGYAVSTSGPVDLDALYPKAVNQSWFVLAYPRLYYGIIPVDVFPALGAAIAAAADVAAALKTLADSNISPARLGTLSSGALSDLNSAIAPVVNTANFSKLVTAAQPASADDFKALALNTALSSAAATVFPGIAEPVAKTAPAISTGLHFHYERWYTLYRVQMASQVSRADFGLSAKITRLAPEDPTNVELFPLSTTIAHLQSDELTPCARPLYYPVYGATLTLGSSEARLTPGRPLAVTGKRQRVALPRDVSKIYFASGATRPLAGGESFVMLAPTAQQSPSGQWQPLTCAALPGAGVNATWRWTLQDDDGSTIQLTAPAGALLLIAPLAADPVLSEIALLDDGADAVSTTATTTTLRFQGALANCYDRLSFAINANVANATHGETVSEIAGSGNAAIANQSFTLHQAPLTYVSSASAAQGAQSTLQVRVNDLLWQEAPSLYAQTGNAHVYSLSQDATAVTTIQFGDGIEGARVPGGQNNVRLQYRKGLGTAGNLRSGQLTSLITRPLGVRAVTNANASTGGQDPESIGSARLNAPLPVLTLDRVVSVDDYANYASAFAGIAKAGALWIAAGRARGMYLTVAGANGSAIPAGSDTQANLAASLASHGDPLIPVSVMSYAGATFTLKLALKCTPDADPAQVPLDVIAALRAAYAFGTRDFGQAVTLDEVYAVIQGVDGVLAADVQQLYRLDTGPLAPQPSPQLPAAVSALQPDGSVNPAELLTLDPGAIDAGVMT
ncbi:putative baseplate assembly protein [Paraburkholderia sp. JHI869]|uniref:putative baseplate assembly protein n=1 Tax=Paraburkholderia sp. JHI869 TaxID=3112959 RepID=UPI00316D6068